MRHQGRGLRRLAALSIVALAGCAPPVATLPDAIGQFGRVPATALPEGAGPQVAAYARAGGQALAVVEVLASPPAQVMALPVEARVEALLSGVVGASMAQSVREGFAAAPTGRIQILAAGQAVGRCQRVTLAGRPHPLPVRLDCVSLLPQGAAVARIALPEGDVHMPPALDFAGLFFQQLGGAVPRLADAPAATGPAPAAPRGPVRRSL